MNRAKYSVLVENYLDGSLDEVQQKKFEAELQVNQTLAMEFRLEKDLERILTKEEMMDFRVKCITAQEEFNAGRLKSTRVLQLARKYWYAAAAFILVLVVVGGLFLLQPGGYSNEKLFKMYYKTGEIGISRSGNADLIQALLKYHDKDYQSAITLFDEILDKDPNNFAIRYYDGISSIEVKDYNKAIKMFQGIIDNGENLYIEYAQWYLGLTYLVNGQTNDASKIFREIADNPNHVHQKDAQSILQKVDLKEKNRNFMNKMFFLILPF
jgi:tetratricopeptide (TPR) repeat protein